mmetsp:Transcript_50757/g.99217  ORF Transcript_50757/g.99217 Transcript_50757/m.99217 type:complete len:313 (+) Transcript_50757:2447-3385(+)
MMPSLTPSKGGTGMEGRMRRRKSRAESVALKKRFLRTSASVYAVSAVLIISFTSRFATASTRVPSPHPPASLTTFSTFPTVLFPAAFSRTSSTWSPLLSQPSPALTMDSSLSTSTISFSAASPVSSPETRRRTYPSALSTAGLSATLLSATTSCFSISTVALFAIGSKSDAVPFSPRIIPAMSSIEKVSPQLSSRSTSPPSMDRMTSSLYTLRLLTATRSVSCASAPFFSAPCDSISTRLLTEDPASSSDTLPPAPASAFAIIPSSPPALPVLTSMAAISLSRTASPTSRVLRRATAASPDRESVSDAIPIL